MRIVRAMLLLSPLLLCGCASIDLSALDLSSIRMPWSDADNPVAPTAVALREDTSDTKPIPDGLQIDDLNVPFGEAGSAP
jgi:hypothetical protein